MDNDYYKKVQSPLFGSPKNAFLKNDYALSSEKVMVVELRQA
jgi:hypothetical protein